MAWKTKVLPVGKEIFVTQNLAVANSKWGAKFVKECLPDADEREEFTFLDASDQHSSEAISGRAQVRNEDFYFNEAPCGTCLVESCPGTIGKCLLIVGPDALGLKESHSLNLREMIRNVMYTSDYVFDDSEKEIFKTRHHANEYLVLNSSGARGKMGQRSF